MVELIDVNVGRVVEHLTKLGELDNTVRCIGQRGPKLTLTARDLHER